MTGRPAGTRASDRPSRRSTRSSAASPARSAARFAASRATRLVTRVFASTTDWLTPPPAAAARSSSRRVSRASTLANASGYCRTATSATASAAEPFAIARARAAGEFQRERPVATTRFRSVVELPTPAARRTRRNRVRRRVTAPVTARRNSSRRSSSCSSVVVVASRLVARSARAAVRGRVRRLPNSSPTTPSATSP